MASEFTAYPYDTVVRITDTIGNQEYQASGVLISPDEVLTASHVVYVAAVGAASDIVVTPAYDDGTAPYGSADGTLVHYFPIDETGGQISNADSQSDYAVIHLSTPFTGLGTMGLSPNFAGGPVTVAGYPASANGAVVASTQTVNPDPDYTLLDGVTIGKGSSGGPLFIGGAADPQVVGIVSSESNVGQTSYNTLITTAVFNQIEQWVEADDATTATSPLPATPSPPATTQTVAVNKTQTGNAEKVTPFRSEAFERGADHSWWNDWTHGLDANSLQLKNGSMAFISSPGFQREHGYLRAAQDTTGTADFRSMFAGLSTFAATNLPHEPGFPEAGANWTGHIQTGGSTGQVGFADWLQNHITTAGAKHDAWVHTS